MVSENPFDQFRQECQTALANALNKDSCQKSQQANHYTKQNTKHRIWPISFIALF